MILLRSQASKARPFDLALGRLWGTRYAPYDEALSGFMHLKDERWR